MAFTLTITGCSVTTDSITISFSDNVDATTVDTTRGPSTSALDFRNYTIYDPPSYPPGTNPDANSISVDGQTVTITKTNLFQPGDFVLIGISNIALASNPGTSALIEDPVSIFRQVPDTGSVARATKDVEDAIAYPILTEEIGYRPSPVGIPTTGGGGGPGGGPSSLGQVALKAVSDVLGWKANTTDPKGFVGALTQAFTLTDVEGHVESTWTPRTYAVQTDLGGGITGAQASLYTRAKDALDMSLSLLAGLYPLDPEADPEYVRALREMARSQMTEIVKELGMVGLPSILRIDTYFGILLGQNPAQLVGPPQLPVQFDPDQIKGTLGTLRDIYGIYFTGNKFNNRVEDEQDITNFRVISDSMTSLMQSWIANRQFFILQPNTPAFFGTQLVLISRQFNVIAETVNEVRFTLDSVFIGPNERQTLLLKFEDGSSPMFLEDLLEEVDNFVTDEGPRLLRDGGRISITTNILPVVQSLQNLVEQAHDPTNIGELPDGFKTARVRNSLDDLQDQLTELIELTEQVEQQPPPTEDKLRIDSIATQTIDEKNNGEKSKSNHISIFGDGFSFDSEVTIFSTTGLNVPILFYSQQRIDLLVPLSSPLSQQPGSHDILVTNPDGESVRLVNAFVINTDGTISPGMMPTVQHTKAPAAKIVARTSMLAGATRVRKGTRSAGKAPTGPGRARGGTLIASKMATGSRPAAVGRAVRAVPPATPPPSAPAATAKAAPEADVSALQNKIQELQSSHNELTQAHKSVLEKVEEMGTNIKALEGNIVSKISDLLQSKGKKKDNGG